MGFTVLATAEVAGVAAFAYGGADLAWRRGMDVVGVASLAVVNGLAGGVVRDVLIRRPVLALHDGRLLGTCLVVTLLVCLVRARMPSHLVEAVDAIGLGLFTVLGTRRALDAGVTDVAAVLLGAVTVGAGSVVRDLLAGVRPAVLYQSELYVTVSAGCAALYVALSAAGVPHAALLLPIAALAAGLRLVARWRGWRSPLPRHTVPDVAGPAPLS